MKGSMEDLLRGFCPETHLSDEVIERAEKSADNMLPLESEEDSFRRTLRIYYAAGFKAGYSECEHDSVKVSSLKRRAWRVLSKIEEILPKIMPAAAQTDPGWQQKHYTRCAKCLYLAKLKSSIGKLYHLEPGL